MISSRGNIMARLNEADRYRQSVQEYWPAEEVPDHRVLLAFNNDSDGIGFRDWWHEFGADEFALWMARRTIRKGGSDVG